MLKWDKYEIDIAHSSEGGDVALRMKFNAEDGRSWRCRTWFKADADDPSQWSDALRSLARSIDNWTIQRIIEDKVDKSVK